MTIRIAHLSDIHFGGENASATWAALDAVAAFDPTLVAVTGDLTLNGLPDEFRAAAAWLQRLPPARLVTPGNHDTPYWNLILRALTPFDRYRRFIGRVDVDSADAPGLVARSLNSARGAQPRLDWSKGAIAMDRLRDLGWGDPAAPVLKLFACHHPLIDIVGAPVTGGVRRGARAAAVLAEVGVDLILTGHVHIPFVLPLPGAAPGRYAIGASTLSLRTRGAPAGFSTITADDQRIEVAAMGWTGTRFEQVRAWSLPRRRPVRSGNEALAKPAPGQL